MKGKIQYNFLKHLKQWWELKQLHTISNWCYNRKLNKTTIQRQKSPVPNLWCVYIHLICYQNYSTGVDTHFPQELIVTSRNMTWLLIDISTVCTLFELTIFGTFLHTESLDNNYLTTPFISPALQHYNQHTSFPYPSFRNDYLFPFQFGTVDTFHYSLILLLNTCFPGF